MIKPFLLIIYYIVYIVLVDTFQIALEVLSSQPVGAFLVRGSTTQTGCFALSVRVPRDFTPAGIAHYLILRTPKGYKIKVRNLIIYMFNSSLMMTKLYDYQWRRASGSQ